LGRSFRPCLVRLRDLKPVADLQLRPVSGTRRDDLPGFPPAPEWFVHRAGLYNTVGNATYLATRSPAARWTQSCRSPRTGIRGWSNTKPDLLVAIVARQLHRHEASTRVWLPASKRSIHISERVFLRNSPREGLSEVAPSCDGSLPGYLALWLLFETATLEAAPSGIGAPSRL
jgi:hypothetical protein